MDDPAVRALVGLLAAQHGAVARAQAGAVGFSKHRVATAKRAGWLREPVPGVLVDGRRSTWHQRLMVGVLAGHGAAAVSHRSAARLHRLDGFERSSNAVVELSTDRRHRLRLPSSVLHHVTPWDSRDVTAIDGIPCTTIERTLADLGSVVRSPKAVARALTSARRAGLDLARLRMTAERLHRPGQAGTGKLIRLIDATPCAGRVPDSWFEELLAACLSDPTLPAIVPQCPIRDDRGRIVARADIGIPAVKLGLEAHSRQFHFGPQREALDEERDLAVATCGWELLYLGWYATKRPAEVLRVVKSVVAVRRRSLAA